MPNVRLIFHGGASPTDENGKPWKKGANENSAFHQAALNVKKDYPQADTIELISLTTAAEVMRRIARCQDRSIKSLDILCHGSSATLNFYRTKRENTGFLARQRDQAEAESKMNFKFALGWTLLDRIDFKKFAIDARVEIHACYAAAGNVLSTTLVRDLSELLVTGGATKSTVVGHTTKIHPLIHGEKSTSIAQQDYRHGERAIYHSGWLMTTTKEKGHLSDAKLSAAIVPKLGK